MIRIKIFNTLSHNVDESVRTCALTHFAEITSIYLRLNNLIES